MSYESCGYPILLICNSLLLPCTAAKLNQTQAFARVYCSTASTALATVAFIYFGYDELGSLGFTEIYNIGSARNHCHFVTSHAFTPGVLSIYLLEMKHLHKVGNSGSQLGP
jgi:hypothetical protein